MKLDCSACKSAESMERAEIHRVSPLVLFIGYVIAIPSAVGAALWGFCMLMLILSGNSIAVSLVPALGTYEHAEVRFPAILAGIVLCAVFAASSLVTGLIGWLIVMKRAVWKCSACGFLLDRA